MLKQKAAGALVLEFGLGPRNKVLSLTLTMLEMSLVGNCQVSQGKQMRLCISQMWVSSSLKENFRYLKFSFWFLSFSSSSMEAKIIF